MAPIAILMSQASDCFSDEHPCSMLLPPRVTEERKRISSVTTYRASHNDRGLPIAEQFTTTLRGRCRLLPAEPTHAIMAS
jgi:hypothetical protein